MTLENMIHDAMIKPQTEKEKNLMEQLCNNFPQKKEPTSAANDIGSNDGENEMNPLPSDNNTQGGKKQVKKVKLGDCARVYDKAIHNRMTEEGFAITEVPNILYELQELEKRGDISNWVFNKIKEAFYDKWDAMEIEVEDDA